MNEEEAKDWIALTGSRLREVRHDNGFESITGRFMTPDGLFSITVYKDNTVMARIAGEEENTVTAIVDEYEWRAKEQDGKDLSNG